MTDTSVVTKNEEGGEKNQESENIPQPSQDNDSKSLKKNEEQKIFEIKPGMLVKVHQKIKEVNPKGEEKERIQIFEGIVLAHHGGKTKGATITVRKESNGVGVEKIFPLSLPTITKIEVIKQAQVKRAKLYYLRDYKKRLKYKK